LRASACKRHVKSNKVITTVMGLISDEGFGGPPGALLAFTLRIESWNDDHHRHLPLS
jgi:hypothetical protein